MGQNECSFVLIHCFPLCLLSPSSCCFFNLKRGSKHTTNPASVQRKIICVCQSLFFLDLSCSLPLSFVKIGRRVFFPPCNPADKRENAPEQKHDLLSHKSTLTAVSDATENEILLPLRSLDEAVIRNSDKSYLYSLLKRFFFHP